MFGRTVGQTVGRSVGPLEALHVFLEALDVNLVVLGPPCPAGWSEGFRFFLHPPLGKSRSHKNQVLGFLALNSFLLSSGTLNIGSERSNLY